MSSPPVAASIPAILLFVVCALFARSYLQLKLQAAGSSYQLAADLSWLVVPLLLGVLMLPVLRHNRQAIASLLRLQDLNPRLVLGAVGLGIALRVASWAGLFANASFQL